MGYSAKIILDSISPAGLRLTTMEVTLPRIVLAEFNTHRQFSRNSASSRAIPVEKMLKRVQEDPFIPVSWGKNQKGMQAEVEFEPHEQEGLRLQWLRARDQAVFSAQSLMKTGVHKQITNRLLEPFLFHTILVTATEWDNFFALRRHKDAQPEIKKGADMMWEALKASTPKLLQEDEWHLPLLQEDEMVLPVDSPKWHEPQGPTVALMTTDLAKKVSAGRCARVSYLTHDGRRSLKDDIELCDRLRSSGHMSPLEHVARPMAKDELDLYRMHEITLESGEVLRTRDSAAAERKKIFDLKVVSVRTTHFDGNFNGWRQFRKELPNEAVFVG